MAARELRLSRRAERDLRKLGAGPELDRVTNGLRRLASAEPNLDVKQLRGRDPWLRLRVGDWRVLYRPFELGFWVERIVHRRDLHRAAESL